ncbi:MAG TPA: UbiA family prenyltransferase, partial [Candidatus Limnocylindrales bacterium]|nr:UbiA family prenyltransferase [Candidatus Limnocylindrales bacterium]
MTSTRPAWSFRRSTARSRTGSCAAISSGSSRTRRLRLALDLVHAGPSLATTAATVACAVALRVPLAYPGFLLTRIAIPMLLVQTSISVLNEWADRERDARSARRRPLQAGLLRPGVALATALGLGAAALAA